MSKEKKQLVFVGLSGGVDSAVAAGLLKERGYQVVGVFMRCWSPETSINNGVLRLRSGRFDSNQIGCGWEYDEEDARQVAAKLAIPFYSWDFTREYKQRVIDYFLDGYQKGITPNPDIMCNREIKFGLFLKKALAMGADFVATGHYVRCRLKIKNKNEKIKNKEEYLLLKGIDGNKDQSYFLWTLTQEQLKYCLFPIGDYEKPKVRALAEKWDLPVKDKPDSQGICFMGKVDVEEFLKANLKMKPGKIKTVDGEIVGEHEGLESYTIGQRRGIKIGGGIPYFVVAKDFKKNELIVAKGSRAEALFEKELEASDLHWISGESPKLPLKCQAKIRYRQPDQAIKAVKAVRAGKAVKAIKVIFDEPQRAVTPGQSIVFYKGEEMLGGGIIE